MKYLFYSLLIGFVFCGCQSKDSQFCKCMEISNRLNEVSNDILKNGRDSKLQNTFRNLKLKKQKACEKYLEMGGKEMLEKKAACQN